MSRKTKEEAQKTRSRIMASALSLFVKKGYDNTTFTDIALRLKMTKGAVYWHFESKADLLSALLREAMSRFSVALAEWMSGREMTYKEVADMLVDAAEQIVADKRRSEFFMLMQTGLKWTDVKLAEVAKKLIAERACGPYESVIFAVEADMAAGRVRKDTVPREVATATVVLWDGMIQRKIEGFLEIDMSHALKKGFCAIWNMIKKEE